MSDILIKSMEMPQTGLYFVSVDNTGGRDKTVFTVERMVGNRDMGQIIVRQIIGSYEAIPVSPHGRCIDADAFLMLCKDYAITPSEDEFCKRLEYALTKAATIIPAEEDE